MNAALKEAIGQKCRKKVTNLEPYDAEEEEEDGELMFDDLKSETIPEKLPFQDVLAERHGKYSAREEFIYLLRNDLLKYFVKSWNGTFLRKKPKRIFDDDSGDESEENENIEEIHSYEDTSKSTRKGSNSKEESNNASETDYDSSWKLSLPDEFANITFINDNTYSGRISRKMMEGEGVYKWSNGARYKGEFERNNIQGKGLLEWNSTCWYEGDFVNGYRHGRGIMVDGDNRYMYTGQWYVGQRHGKGYCRYGDNGSYDGDWVMDKMSGIGLRIYPSGARYVGQWKNGLREGIGTMVWTNGSVYRGNWKCGAMNGYGECVWNGFFNETFTWPQEASYAGHWRHGLQHGKGLLKLNTVGGAKFSGDWKDNKKHGHGMLIGNNGEKFEANPLFLNDTLVSSDTTDGTLENQSESKNTKECVRPVKEVKPLFPERPEQLEETSITPLLKPEQCPSLSYYIARLLDPRSLDLIVHSVPSGKCYSCENISCACLAPPATEAVVDKEKIAEETKDTPVGSPTENTAKCEREYEERWTYNCLTLHMYRLRQIYKDYAKLFATFAPKCNLVMSRLCLWQLWRDCGIDKKGLNFVDIDNHMAKNESTFISDPYHPFEKIEIWQFLHALLEVSWHLYTKHDALEIVDMNGKLATGLHKLLKNDIYPHAGNHVGSLWREYQDILPMHSTFELYQKIGYPCSSTNLLQAICVSKGTPDPEPSTATDETAKYFPDGTNCVTIGEKISYRLKLDAILAPPCYRNDTSEICKNTLPKKLSVFKELGATKLVEIMTLICSSIKDANSGIIVDMDYKLTFLEFYEILLEATEHLISLKKEAEQEVQRKIIETETTSLKNNNLQEKRTSQNTGSSSTRKNYKAGHKIAM